MIEIILVIIVALIIYLIYNNIQLTKKLEDNDKDVQVNNLDVINNNPTNFTDYNPYVYDRYYNPFYFPYYSYYSYEPRPVSIYHNTNYRNDGDHGDHRDHRDYRREYNHVKNNDFKRGEHNSNSHKN